MWNPGSPMPNAGPPPRRTTSGRTGGTGIGCCSAAGGREIQRPGCSKRAASFVNVETPTFKTVSFSRSKTGCTEIVGRADAAAPTAATHTTCNLRSVFILSRTTVSPANSAGFLPPGPPPSQPAKIPRFDGQASPFPPIGGSTGEIAWWRAAAIQGSLLEAGPEVGGILSVRPNASGTHAVETPIFPDEARAPGSSMMGDRHPRTGGRASCGALP